MCSQMSAAKHQEREAARIPRLAGVPIKQIARELEVSPGSVHVWTRDIELTAEQIDANRRRAGGNQDAAVVQARAAKWVARSRQLRERFQEEGREAARRGDQLHLVGCMLHWAEGSKNRNRVTFVNSDPQMVAVFRRFLSECLGISAERMAVSLNVYTNNGLTIEQIEDHWLGLLELPRACLRKHTLNHMPTSSSGRSRNKLPYGVCRIDVPGTRAVQHIYGAIQEYIGFGEPRWLD
jgi:hypothetical protein